MREQAASRPRASRLRVGQLDTIDDKELHWTQSGVAALTRDLAIVKQWACRPTRTAFEGFCSRSRRRHHEVDARSSSRHERGNHGRQCTRGGKVVPRPQPQVGRHSPRRRRWCPTQSGDEASSDVWLPRRQGRGGSSPRASSLAPQLSGDPKTPVMSCRVTVTSEDDEPLVQSCVQDTALDSVRVYLTVNDPDEEAVVTRGGRHSFVLCG